MNIGDIVGAYKLVKLLGQGGMGAVYLGEHQLIGRRAAIKVLLPQVSSRPEMVARFFNEARAVAQIGHPGLVDVLDFGHTPDGTAWLVMELLEGESLAQCIRRKGRLGHTERCIIARQIAVAVEAAHARQIIHRDLKPDNVFLVHDPTVTGGTRVKVLDFGIAKLGGDAAPKDHIKTETQAFLGTPAYMSPEQCRGAGFVDHRSDIYSLGVILFEMACGRPPFQAPGVGDVIMGHMSQPPPDPASLEPTIEAGLRELILRMLAKDPAARPATMNEVARTLDAIASTPAHPVALASPLAPTLLTPAAGAVSTLGGSASQLAQASPSAPPVARTGRRRTWLLWAAAGVAVSTGVVVAVGLSRSRQAIAPAPAAAVQPPTVPASRPPPDAAAAPSGIAMPAAPVAAPPKVRLALESEPSGAEVYRAADGLLLGQGPATL